MISLNGTLDNLIQACDHLDLKIKFFKTDQIFATDSPLLVF